MPGSKRKRFANWVRKNQRLKPWMDELDTLSNSSAVSELMSFMRPKDTRPSDKFTKSVMSMLAWPRIIPPLPPTDVDSALNNLRNLQGFEQFESQLTVLKNRFDLYREQGAELLQDKRIELHAVIFSVNPQLAVQFAKHYHAFLTAAGVFTAEEDLIRADGTDDRAVNQVNGCDMCLIQNGERLSSGGTSSLVSTMSSGNVVVIINYNSGNEKKLPSRLRDQFLLRFDLMKETSEEIIQNVLREMERRIGERYKTKMTLEGGFDGQYARAFAKRIAKEKEVHEGEMKARLDIALRAVAKRQADRIGNGQACETKPDVSWINREDLLGPEPDVNSFDSDGWLELEKMVGLKEVKESLRSLISGLAMNRRREENGQDPIHVPLSRLFIGPPGTGKTSVAKLYGEILSAFNILSPGGFVSKNANEFIAPYVGQSEDRTRKIFKEAQGKVLMIDEAYMLDPYRSGWRDGGVGETFRQGVLDTIVGEMSNAPGENICVILCGYKEDMEKMLRGKANDGLLRRFPFESAFVFEEFDLNMLELVLEQKMRKDGVKMTDEAKRKAMDILRLARQGPKFGNGGEINNLLGRAQMRYQNRIGNFSADDQTHEICYEVEDIDPDGNSDFRIEDQIEQHFDAFVGLDDVKGELLSLIEKATGLRKAGRDPAPFMPYQFIFKGPPGTAKSAVAKKMGWLYHTLRLLPTKQIEEVSARHMMPDRFNISIDGQSSKPVEVLEKALGKVLIIDEAHHLVGSANDLDNMAVKKVREELVDVINKPRFLGKVLIILVGHEKGMDTVLAADSNLESRFRDRLRFRSLTNPACLDLLQRRLQTEEVAVVLTEQEQDNVKKAFGTLGRSNEWANGRDIELVVNKIVGDIFRREGIAGTSPTVTGSEILGHLREMFPRHLRIQSSTRLKGGQEAGKTRSDSDEHLSKASTASKAVDHSEKDSGHLSEPSRTFEMPNPPVFKAEISLRSKADLSSFEYHDLPQGRYIRVLHLQPASNHGDPIECKIEEICLDSTSAQRRQFSALSYVWGDKHKTQSILCDGKKKLVTMNCELALRHLRHKQRSRSLWIDAISINQGSDKELNHQVSLMGDIFRYATHVYIWLGLGAPDVDTKTALTRLQKFCCLRGDWDEHELIRMILLKSYQWDREDYIALSTIMNNDWWQRMWTFQEFILARRPVFVIGDVQISFEDFFTVFTELFIQKDMRRKASRPIQRITNGTTAIDHLMPHGVDDSDSLRASMHMAPSWMEVADAVTCRRAYQERHEKMLRPAFMSYILLKARNRDATDVKDKIYGLHYLFEAYGYHLPEIDYRRPVANIYTDFVFALVRHSESWWILSHLFNKREGSTLDLPSWVPEFSRHARWHQHINLRLQNINNLAATLEDMEMREALAKRPVYGKFGLSTFDGGISTNAVFLWTVNRATSEMASNPNLDLSFDETFEQSSFEVLNDATEEFLFTLASWLKSMEPDESTSVSESSDDNAVVLGNQDLEDIRSEVLRGIACAFWRSSHSTIRGFWKKGLRIMEEKLPELEEMEEMDESEPKPPPFKAESDLAQVQAADLLPTMLQNIRACFSPDKAHPCRICATTAVHWGNEANRHFMTWLHSQVSDKSLIFIVYLLYTRAVDHSMFLTSASDGGCPGHFGFCRNFPRAGDSVVLLPGLEEPVIVRPRSAFGGRDDCYRIVGVTSGMTGPAVSRDEIGPGAYERLCFGECPEMEISEGHESRSISLV